MNYENFLAFRDIDSVEFRETDGKVREVVANCHDALVVNALDFIGFETKDGGTLLELKRICDARCYTTEAYSEFGRGFSNRKASRAAYDILQLKQKFQLMAFCWPLLFYAEHAFWGLKKYPIEEPSQAAIKDSIRVRMLRKTIGRMIRHAKRRDIDSLTQDAFTLGIIVRGLLPMLHEEQEVFKQGEKKINSLKKAWSGRSSKCSKNYGEKIVEELKRRMAARPDIHRDDHIAHMKRPTFAHDGKRLKSEWGDRKTIDKYGKTVPEDYGKRDD